MGVDMGLTDTIFKTIIAHKKIPRINRGIFILSSTLNLMRLVVVFRVTAM
jgi:hypothetical protein